MQEKREKIVKKYACACVCQKKAVPLRAKMKIER